LIFDHILLVPVYPSGEEHHQNLERKSIHRFNLRPNRSRKLGRDRQTQRAARPWKRDGFCSAEFSHTTRRNGPKPLILHSPKPMELCMFPFG
jgi:hypothetical protein